MIFAHVLVVLPAFTLSESLDLPFATLLFTMQVLVLAADCVYPLGTTPFHPETAKEEACPSPRKQSNTSPEPDDIGKTEALQKHFTKIFENMNNSPKHVTNVLGYPKELLDYVVGRGRGALALDSCGAGCPFLAARFGEFTGKTVVEFGSGTGQDAFMSQRLGAKAVLGLDMTPAAIKVSTAQWKKLQPFAKSSIVKFQLQAIDVDFDASLKGMADIVLSNGVINLCSRKLKVFQNAYDVLKSTGVFLFADVVSLKPPSKAPT